MGEVPVDCRKMAGTGTLPEWTGVALVVQQRDHRGSIDTVDRYPAGAEFEARIASPELKTVRSSGTIDRLFLMVCARAPIPWSLTLRRT